MLYVCWSCQRLRLPNSARELPNLAKSLIHMTAKLCCACRLEVNHGPRWVDSFFYWAVSGIWYSNQDNLQMKERSQMRKFIQEQKIIIFLHFLNPHQYVNDLRWIIFYFLNNNSTFVRIQCCMIWFVYGFFKFFLIQKRLWQASKAVRTIWVMQVGADREHPIHIWGRI